MKGGEPARVCVIKISHIRQSEGMLSSPTARPLLRLQPDMTTNRWLRTASFETMKPCLSRP